MTEVMEVVTVTEQVRKYIANAKILAKDGLTVAEFGELATELMRVLVAAMDSIDAAGPKKSSGFLQRLVLCSRRLQTNACLFLLILSG